MYQCTPNLSWSTTTNMKNKFKFYKLPWNEKNVETMRTWWPHFGTYGLAPMVQLSRQQVKSKATNLGLVLLPKEKRLCLGCKTEYQVSRRYGLHCRKCALANRKVNNQSKQKPREIWMKDLLRSIKYRADGKCDLDVKYLLETWNRQSGACFYTGEKMREPIFYGGGRHFDTASIDRIDSKKSYTKGNVVWCMWAINCAKSDLDIGTYISMCESITRNKSKIMTALSPTIP